MCGVPHLYSSMAKVMMNSHPGFPSSHFFLRFRQVKQPVLDLPLATLFWLAAGEGFAFLGRPLPRFGVKTAFFFSEASDSSDFLRPKIRCIGSSSTSSIFSSAPGLPLPSESSDSPSVVVWVSEPMVVTENEELLEHPNGDAIGESNCTENRARASCVLLSLLSCDLCESCLAEFEPASNRLHEDHLGGDAARMGLPSMDEAGSRREGVCTCRRSAGSCLRGIGQDESYLKFGGFGCC